MSDELLKQLQQMPLPKPALRADETLRAIALQEFQRTHHENAKWERARTAIVNSILALASIGYLGWAFGAASALLSH